MRTGRPLPTSFNATPRRPPPLVLSNEAQIASSASLDPSSIDPKTTDSSALRQDSPTRSHLMGGPYGELDASGVLPISSPDLVQDLQYMQPRVGKKNKAASILGLDALSENASPAYKNFASHQSKAASTRSRESRVGGLLSLFSQRTPVHVPKASSEGNFQLGIKDDPRTTNTSSPDSAASITSSEIQTWQSRQACQSPLSQSDSHCSSDFPSEQTIQTTAHTQASEEPYEPSYGQSAVRHTFLDPPTPTHDIEFESYYSKPLEPEHQKVPQLEATNELSITPCEESPPTPAADDLISQIIHSIPEPSPTDLSGKPAHLDQGFWFHGRENSKVRIPGPMSREPPLVPPRLSSRRPVRTRPAIAQPTIDEECEIGTTDQDRPQTSPHPGTPSGESKVPVVRNFSHIRKYHSRSGSNSSRISVLSRASSIAEITRTCTPTLTPSEIFADASPRPTTAPSPATTLAAEKPLAAPDQHPPRPPRPPQPPEPPLPPHPPHPQHASRQPPPEPRPQSDSSVMSAEWGLTSKERLSLGARVTRNDDDGGSLPWETTDANRSSRKPSFADDFPSRPSTAVSLGSAGEAWRLSRFGQAFGRW